MKKYLLVLAALLAARPAAAQEAREAGDRVGAFVFTGLMGQMQLATVPERGADGRAGGTLSFGCVWAGGDGRRVVVLEHRLPTRLFPDPGVLATSRFAGARSRTLPWLAGELILTLDDEWVEKFWAEAPGATAVTVEVPHANGVRTYRFDLRASREALAALGC